MLSILDRPTIGVSLLLLLKITVTPLVATRTLECKNHGLNVSRCSLLSQGRQAELNPGCFDELDEVGF